MNIFVLSQLFGDSARWHCDKHCVKMIVETCQLLYTAWWHGRTKDDIKWVQPELEPWRATFKNHPCALWVRAESAHYFWALDHGIELCKEYTRRYSTEKETKIHSVEKHLRRLR